MRPIFIEFASEPKRDPSLAGSASPIDAKTSSGGRKSGPVFRKTANHLLLQPDLETGNDSFRFKASAEMRKKSGRRHRH